MKKYFNIKDALESSKLFTVLTMNNVRFKEDKENNNIDILVSNEEIIDDISKLVESDIFMGIEIDQESEENNLTIRLASKEELEEVEFSQYRLNTDSEKMYNPEENITDYGVLMDEMFGKKEENKMKVSSKTLSKIDKLLGYV